MDDARASTARARAHPLLATVGVGIVTMCVFEGGRAALSCVRSGGGAKDALAAFLVAYAFVLLPLAVAGALLAVLVLREGAKRFAHRLAVLLLGERGNGSAGLALAGTVLAASALVAATVGRRAGSAAGANVAVSVTVITMVVAVTTLAPVCSFVATYVGSKAEHRPRLARVLAGLGSELMLLTLGSAAAAVASFALLPRSYLGPTGSGLVAFLLLSGPEGRSLVANRLKGTPALIALAVALAPCPAAPLILNASSTPTRNGVFYGAPLTFAVISFSRGLVDRDHDGYSPILLGGDCNDDNPRVNPGATEIPENGIDENCSGADGRRYVPVTEPAFATPPAMPSRPNIVVVQFDALRPDHLGQSRYARPTSPHLDAFRAQGVAFTNAYSPSPNTRFALTSLFFGRDMLEIPYTHGDGNDIDVAPSVGTLAARLGAFGYERVGFTISFVLQHVRGLEAGFDRWETPWPTTQWQEAYPTMAQKTTDAAVTYLAQKPASPERPFFLFVHYACTHDPYAPDGRWDYGTRPVDRYDSAVNHCDDEFGKLLSAIDARPDADRTHVLALSDHGELFGEHGFWNHSHSVFEPDVRVLLTMRARGLGAGQVIDAPVSLTDVHSTVLALAGAPKNEHATASWNLLRYVTQPEKSDAARPLFLFTETRSDGVTYDARAVLASHMKLVADRTTRTTALFDVRLDPQEQHDLSAAAPMERARLTESLDEWSRPRDARVVGTR